MLVNLRVMLVEFVSKQHDQVLHQIALPHQQVLPNVHAVSLQLVLVKQDSQKLLIGHLMSCLDPLLQLIYVQIGLLSYVEWSLQRHV